MRPRSYVLCGAISSALMLASLQAPAEETKSQTGSQSSERIGDVIVLGSPFGTDGHQPARSYRAEEAATATKSSTPIRETPASVQVVPWDVFAAKRPVALAEAAEVASGVRASCTFGNRNESFLLRGFQGTQFAKDGDTSLNFGEGSFFDLSNVERLEILKGPASVLYGRGDPGGLVNLVTKKPLQEQLFVTELFLGSEEYGRVAVDWNQPFRDQTMGVRVNASYQEDNGFQEFFVPNERAFVAPSFVWEVGESTHVWVDADATKQRQQYYKGLVAVGNEVLDVPHDRFLGEDWSRQEYDAYRLRYEVEHKISDTWAVRQYSRWQNGESERLSSDFVSVQPDGRTLRRRATDQQDTTEQLSVNLDVQGKLASGEVTHNLLFGVERSVADREALVANASLADFNMITPTYGALPGAFGPKARTYDETDLWAAYAQDQMDVGERWKILTSLRYDNLDSKTQSSTTNRVVQDGEFSPRAGVMYDVTPAVSVYASWANSFKPVTSGISLSGEGFDPESSEQYEVGVKADLFDDRYTVTLAAFDLIRSNVVVPDPVNAGYSIQTGEQRSTGAELDVAGELVPGWNVIGSAAYTDARVTRDTRYPSGNSLFGVAKFMASLWTTYTPQGMLEDWTFGLGAVHVGDREGDIANTYQVDGFNRFDVQASRTLGPVEMTLTVKNALNERYIDSPVNRLEIYPGAPRTWLVHAIYRMN